MIGKSIKCTSALDQQAGHDFACLVSVYGQSVGVVQLALMFNQKESEIVVVRRLLQTVISAPEFAKTLPECVSLDMPYILRWRPSVYLNVLKRPT
ncbi:MAG: hypothetical protein F6K11_32120 [Leptolyngbya sp. SIO3F4]|nr:hypothetical protein [Leptolyngbya sp. SIO3F4]